MSKQGTPVLIWWVSGVEKWFNKARTSVWCSQGMVCGVLAVAAGVTISFPDGVVRGAVAGGLVFVAMVIGLIRLLILQYAEDYRGPRTCCPKCGYDLTGNVSGVCPECGWVWPRRKAE